MAVATLMATATIAAVAPASAATPDPDTFVMSVAKAAAAEVKRVTGETLPLVLQRGSVAAKVPTMQSYVQVPGYAVTSEGWGGSLSTKANSVYVSTLDKKLRARGLTRIVTKVGARETSLYKGNGLVCGINAPLPIACATAKRATSVIKGVKPLLQKMHEQRGMLYAREWILDSTTRASSYQGYASRDLRIMALGAYSGSSTALYYKSPTSVWRFAWAGKAEFPPCEKMWAPNARYKAFYGEACEYNGSTYIVGAVA
ncbi:hypothetical protein [Demequina silvatica]|uniref:hypothetical protein n=1 Tax=Demequina silvatica TaxID=1638988 RepID=UPI0012E059B7|nr:hypothetical protein [Demequina silvatica]